MKSLVTMILLLFVAVSVGYLVLGGPDSKPAADGVSVNAPNGSQPPAVPPSPSTAPAAASEAQTPTLIAYYFHATQRCPTCLRMERYAREAIADAYSAELATGRVQWQSVNYDDPANEHFVQRYGLYASALILVPGEAGIPPGGQKLERIWDLVGDEAAFKTYVLDEAAKLLGNDS